MKEKVLELLRKPDVISKYGLEFHEIKDYFGCDDKQLKNMIKELKKEKLIAAIPFKRAGRWYLRYYSPPHGKTPVRDRIEEILTELAIPPWVKTRVFRGAKVIFVGEYGKTPGFTIINYSEDPTLVFRDRFAGGDPNEIVNYKSRSKYKCSKDDRVIWYNYNGKRIRLERKQTTLRALRAVNDSPS